MEMMVERLRSSGEEEEEEESEVREGTDLILLREIKPILDEVTDEWLHDERGKQLTPRHPQARVFTQPSSLGPCESYQHCLLHVDTRHQGPARVLPHLAAQATTVHALHLQLEQPIGEICLLRAAAPASLTTLPRHHIVRPQRGARSHRRRSSSGPCTRRARPGHSCAHTPFGFGGQL